MKKSSEVLGLRVIGIREGMENGIAQDFMIDTESKKIKYLILKSSSGYGFRVMNVTDVEAIGADYIITGSVENAINIYESKEIMEEIEKGFFILGTTVLSSSGNIIGTVSDFTFEEKTGEMDRVILNDGYEFSASNIATLAGKMVFINEEGAVSKPAEPAIAEAVAEPVIEEQIAEEPAIIEEATPVVEEAVIAEEVPVAEIEVPAAAEEAPARSALEQESITFLLGKTVKSEVLSDDGMFRLEAGTELTEEIINLAEKHDAILTLTLSV